MTLKEFEKLAKKLDSETQSCEEHTPFEIKVSDIKHAGEDTVFGDTSVTTNVLGERSDAVAKALCPTSL
jgi:hypothetical protein